MSCGGPAGGSARPFRLLLVCTANVCRSPLAEAAFAGITPCSCCAVDVSSAGTAARPGLPAAGPTLATARALGLDLSRHASRPLTREVVDDADLVLALSREHRADVARLSPRAASRTFTLREFAHLATVAAEGPPAASVAAESAGLHAVVAGVGAMRGRGPRLAEVDYDVADPFGGDAEAYLVATTRILESVLTVSAQLSSLQARARHA